MSLRVNCIMTRKYLDLFERKTCKSRERAYAHMARSGYIFDESTFVAAGSGSNCNFVFSKVWRLKIMTLGA